MTTDIADALTSAQAIGEGTLLSPGSRREMLAPPTSAFEPWDDDRWYGLGVFVIDGWILQNPSFAGYAATIAYLPSRKLAIAVATTLAPGAAPEGNLSSIVLARIAGYLAPEAPLAVGGG